MSRIHYLNYYVPKSLVSVKQNMVKPTQKYTTCLFLVKVSVFHGLYIENQTRLNQWLAFLQIKTNCALRTIVYCDDYIMGVASFLYTNRLRHSPNTHSICSIQ